MCKNDLEKMVRMSQEEYMQQNPNYEPMFPKGWDDDSRWPESKYDYDSFRSTQIAIDHHLEVMAGCWD
jgi:hypothetical protein